MQTNEDRFVSPTDAYSYARLVYGIERAGKDATLEIMPKEALKWAAPKRGPEKGNHMALRVDMVHLGEYVKAARIVAETVQAERVNRSSSTLEARVAALEAAFDSLLATTKGIA